jgi:hypothetical protein
MSCHCTHFMYAFAASVLIGVIASAPAHADDASCKPVSDAMMKQARTPYHEIATVGGRSFEKICTASTLYIGMNGHWTKTPMTPQDLIDVMRETGVSLSNCRSLRTETVDGQAATVYAAHLQTTTPASSSDSQIWIGNASGLTLKTEADTLEGGRKVHVLTHFVQGNVQPPAGVQ